MGDFEDLNNDDRDMRAVLDSALCAVVIENDEGRFVELNPATEKLFGATRSALLGREVKDFVHERNGNHVVIRPDGTERLIQYSSINDFVPGYRISIAVDLGQEGLP